MKKLLKTIAIVTIPAWGFSSILAIAPSNLDASGAVILGIVSIICGVIPIAGNQNIRIGEKIFILILYFGISVCVMFVLGWWVLETFHTRK